MKTKHKNTIEAILKTGTENVHPKQICNNDKNYKPFVSKLKNEQ